MVEMTRHQDGTLRAESNGVLMIIGMGMDEYHRTAKDPEEQFYSKTRLQAILQADRGPEWVYNTWIKHPDATIEDEGDRDVGDSKEAHLRVGRAIDTRLFDGTEEYAKLFVVPPETYPSPMTATECKKNMVVPGSPEAMIWKKWHTNADYCKSWEKEQYELGKTPLSRPQADWVERAYHSLMRHPRVAEIMADPNWIAQVSFRWTCPFTGRKMQCRPDLVNIAARSWGDLKTTRYWLSEAYGREFFNRGYHLQAWMIDYAVSRFCGDKVESRFHIICGKQHYPQTKIWDLAPIHIDAGKDYLMRCHAEYARCEASGKWYEVQEQPETLHVPAFIQAMHMRREDMAKTEFYDYGATTFHND